MLADRMGHQPRSLVRRSRHVRPRRPFAAAWRAYLMLIDRENPLSSTGRRI